MFAADKLLDQSPVGLGAHVRDVEVRLNRVIVAHLLAPENLPAQVKFPLTRNRVLAAQRRVRDDLFPAIFRVAEDQRARFFEPVVPPPQIALDLFAGARRQRRYMPGQIAQKLRVKG